MAFLFPIRGGPFDIQGGARWIHVEQIIFFKPCQEQIIFFSERQEQIIFFSQRQKQIIFFLSVQENIFFHASMMIFFTKQSKSLLKLKPAVLWAFLSILFICWLNIHALVWRSYTLMSYFEPFVRSLSSVTGVYRTSITRKRGCTVCSKMVHVDDK